MRQRLYCALAFALLFSACLAAQNVFVLPSGSSSSVTVLGADPFSQVATLNVTTAGISVLAGPNGKFYIISNVGNGNPTVAAVTQNADGTFGSNVKNVGSFVGALAAAISPDLRHLVVQSSGALNIIDTSNDTVLPVAFGGLIVDFAISADSSRVFVVNTTTSVNQALTVDLKTGATVATGAVLGTPNNVVVGPTGRVYVSTTGALLELDPATLATTRSIQVTGRPGKLSITPDGKLGIAVNLNTTINGTTALLFDLNNRTVLSSIPNSAFGDAFITQIVPVSNSRAFAFSPGGQPGQGALFDVALNPVNAGPFSFAPAGTVSSFAVSNDVAGGAHAGTQYLFFNSNNTIYRFDLLANQITGQQTVPNVPGAIAFAAEPITNGTPASLLTYGDNQTITLQAPSAPFGVRVVDAQGRPLAGVTVSFSVAAAPGVTLGAASVVTDTTGIALTTLTASVAGSVPVTVTAGPLTTTITVNVGGGAGGPSQSGCLTILSGQGQVVQTQFPGQPLVVQCADSSGNPVANQPITFTIISGPPNAQINSFANGIGGIAGQTTIVPTDTKTGEASVVFINTCGINGSFGCPSQSLATIQATAPDGSVVTFYVTTTAFIEQAIAAFPPGSTITMSSGSKNTSTPITATVTTSDPGISPTPIPYVGLRIINPPGSDPALPVAAKCDGSGGFALSALLTDKFGDTSATITCNLIATGSPRQIPYTLFAEIGGNLIQGPFQLFITPGAPAKVSIISGDLQSGNLGQKLPTPLVVVVTDAAGNLLPGVPVTFSVVSGSATLSTTSIAADSQGRASTIVTLGNTPGIVQIKATAGSASLTFSETIVTPATAVKLVSGSGQSALVNTAFVSPIVVQVVDAKGNGVPGVTVSFIATSGSVSAATPQIVTDAQGNASTKVTAGATPGPAVITAAAAGFSATVSLTVLAPGPTGIVFLNGAGFQPGLSPGAIVAVQGSGLVPAQGVFVPANIIGPLPTSFQGITIAFNGVAAPIFSVSNVNGVQQVVVQVPFETAGATSANVTITTAAGGTTTLSNVPLAPFSPGIFETTAFGQRQAVALHADGSYVSPSNPAHKGENITIYLTGLGQTTPALFTNSAGVGGQRVNATVSAGINNAGVPIATDSSGKPLVLAAPGLVGVYTLTLQVPSDAPSGNIPLNVTVFDAANNQYLAQGSILPIQ